MRTLLCCLLVSSVAIADEIYTVKRGGEVIDVTSIHRCFPPQTRNGIVRINCSAFDGPVYFFDESTRENISICPFWGCDLLDDDEKKQTCRTECPPKQWPLEVPDCDKQFVESILGTWRLESTVSPGGLAKNHGGWSMTIAADSMLFDFYKIVQIERSFAVIHNKNRQYILEQKDETGETETINIKLMPCGLMVDSEAVCSAFCENFLDEFSEEDRRIIILKLLSDAFDDSTVEEIIKRSAEERGQHPVFQNHSFFREVITD